MKTLRFVLISSILPFIGGFLTSTASRERKTRRLWARVDPASRDADRRRKAELYEQEKAAAKRKLEEAEAKQARRMVEQQSATAAASESVQFDPRVSPHLQGSAHSTVGVIIVDHGSRREAANQQLLEMAEAVKKHSGRRIVEAAHMELAEPSIADAYAACVEKGATSVVCHPFFLSPGRHVTEDIPALLAEAAAPFLPDVPYVLTLPLGASEMVPGLIEEFVATTLKYYPPTNGVAVGSEPSQLGFIGEVMRMAEAAAAENAASTPAPETPPASTQEFIFDPRVSPNEQ